MLLLCPVQGPWASSFNILTSTLILYNATICKPVCFTTSSIYCLTSNKKIYVTFSLDKIEENGILHKNLKTTKEFTIFLLYFIIRTLLLDLKTMGLTRFILIFIKLFWVLKLLYGFSQIQKPTYVTKCFIAEGGGMRVGGDFQAKVPEFKPGNQSINEGNQHCKCLWHAKYTVFVLQRLNDNIVFMHMTECESIII